MDGRDVFRKECLKYIEQSASGSGQAQSFRVHLAVRLIEWVSTSFRAWGRTPSLSLTRNALLISCINSIHPRCLEFITHYWSFFAMPHVETMPVRLSIVDLVSATKQLVDFHEMRYRNSLQKLSSASFVKIGAVTVTLCPRAYMKLCIL